MSQSICKKVTVSKNAIKRYKEEIANDYDVVSEKMDYVIKNMDIKYRLKLEGEGLGNVSTVETEVFSNSKNYIVKSFTVTLGQEDDIGMLKINKEEGEPTVIINSLFNLEEEKRILEMNNINLNKTTKSFVVESGMLSILSIFDLICPKRVYKYISNLSMSEKKEYSNKIKKYVIISPIRYYYQITRKTNKRKYERKTDSWEVKGFYRRYKSGKKVYVKPFTKGKGRNEKKERVLI